MRERCWGGVGRRGGGTYGRRIEVGEESRLRDGENMWCSALPSRPRNTDEGTTGQSIMISSSHPTPTPHLALATAPILPMPPQRLSRTPPTPLARPLTPISSHISHALSATLPPVELCFFSPSHLMLRPPHRYLTTSAPVLALTFLHHTFFTPHPTRLQYYVNRISPYHEPSSTLPLIHPPFRADHAIQMKARQGRAL